MATVARRYRLVSQAGTGGMAEVWRAVDTRLDRTVAVKLLLPDLAGSGRARDRAEAEARAVARINHTNVAAVFDAGHRSRGLRRPAPYLVMEYVDGQTLDGRLSGPRSLDWLEATHIAVQVADALAAAHLHRVVHRDIKPGNIMVTNAGVKVIDFGLAAILSAIGTGPVGVILGTPEYMAPEQLRGDPVTAASDMYAFGLVMYRMLTSALPWTEPTRHAIMRQRRSWRSLRLPPISGVPAEVVAVVDACLAEEPESRPSSRTVARVLRSAMARHADEADPVVTFEPVAAPYRPHRPEHPCTVPWRSKPARPWRRRAALIAAVVLVGAGGWIRPLWPTAAASAGGEHIGSRPRCAVRYIGHRTASSFAAAVTVTGDGPGTWTLQFAAPPGQRVTDVAGSSWTQSGSTVTVTGHQSLTADAPATIELRGVLERSDAGFPTAFTLDGASCQRSVAISAVGGAGLTGRVSGTRGSAARGRARTPRR
ncbi:serine/threonine-protein kinase [Dactylosporangium sp. CA-139114]|uniref:serine/threonine-protein kinase n=1 Tax=Dactylosporangium sp. CA-139114 TaxID=3239931 RepID=UPI003D981670